MTGTEIIQVDLEINVVNGQFIVTANCTECQWGTREVATSSLACLDNLEHAEQVAVEHCMTSHSQE